jgi:glycosyltransferase A (GT-A) superfamily protein (DUF2064 family)
MRAQLLVMAKAPMPGRAKTRLCPPCTPQQAAAIAGAALLDTLAATDRATVVRRTVVLSGEYAVPCGWSSVAQRGEALGDRLANAFADTALPGVASLVIGMDTPQVDAELLAAVTAPLHRVDAVLAMAEDGGFWALALRDPVHGAVLRAVPMSRADTGARTAAALFGHGLGLEYGPVLRDVDTAADAVAVANDVPDGRFAAAVRRYLRAEGDAMTSSAS